jgi:hypothetical protein
VPTPLPSVDTTPLSSEYPSAYASEDETEYKGRMIVRYPVPALTQKDFDIKVTKSRLKNYNKPFRLLDLPAELRLKIYGFHFADITGSVDLAPDNHNKIYKKLVFLRACRTVYREASYAFFSQHIFRVFPTHGLFFKAKKPILARLSPRQREQISTLELRVGPGFNKPPRSWKVNDALGLADCTSVKRLNIFVECDPSDKIFNGFRRADGFYEEFCAGLMAQILAAVPSIEAVRFDGNPAIRKDGAMMRALLTATADADKPVGWGPLRGWTDADEEEVEEVNPFEALLEAVSPSLPMLGTTALSLVAVA